MNAYLVLMIIRDQGGCLRPHGGVYIGNHEHDGRAVAIQAAVQSCPGAVVINETLTIQPIDPRFIAKAHELTATGPDDDFDLQARRLNLN